MLFQEGRKGMERLSENKKVNVGWVKRRQLDAAEKNSNGLQVRKVLFCGERSHHATAVGHTGVRAAQHTDCSC